MSIFNAFVELAGATGRPVVFFDFETAGLDAPPVELGLIVFSVGEETVSDALIEARRLLELPIVASGPRCAVGEYASYALHTRLNPGCKIRPGARAVHGIRDEDVSGAPAYNDPALVEILTNLDAIDPIWCGHNIVAFDLPVAERYGMLPHRKNRKYLDTFRWVHGLATYEPYPTCYDPTLGMSDPERGQVVPVCEVGLHNFRSRLESLHCALCGWSFAGAHGAMADVIANVRVAARLFDLWLYEGFEVMRRSAEAGHFDANSALDAVLTFCDRPPADMTGHDGWLRQVDVGDGNIDFEIQKGKNRGRLLGELSLSDMRWLAELSDIDDSTRVVLRGCMGVSQARERKRTP